MSTQDLPQQMPSLFDTPPPAAVRRSAKETKEEKAENEDKAGDSPATDFVRWCWSLGDGFRNSPDVQNLRYWAQKHEIKMQEHEEAKILAAARPLFMKRVGQLTSKADGAN